MKIYLDKCLTKDLSEFSDEQLSEWDVYREDAKPIVLKNLFVEKNKDGHLVVSFETVNHKYLNLSYCTTSNRRKEENASYCVRGMTMETFEKYKDLETTGFDLRLPVSSTTLWFEPDTEEENILLQGVLAQVSSRWEYQTVIVPFENFFPEVKSEDKIEEMEEEMIYEYAF